MDYLFELFRTIRDIENEKTKRIMNGDSSEYTGLDIVTELFFKHSKIAENGLIPFFKENFNNTILDEYFSRGYTRFLNKKKEDILQRIQCEQTEKFYMPQIERLDTQLENAVSIELFLKYEAEELELYDMVEIYNNEYRYINKTDGREFIRKNYLTLCLCKACYEIYRSIDSEKNKFEYCYDEISGIYNSIGINILTQDREFSKYKLLSYTDNFEIHNTKESRTIYDKRIDSYFWISVPRLLLKCFEQCINEGFITNIAFKVDGVTKVLPAFEDLEIGAKFSFDLISLPQVSKLYDAEDYDNGLWIKHDKYSGDLTFEEICSNFTENDESIVTQVVHIKYSTNSCNEYIIIHMDHEYIFYSLDEYEKRQKDATQKGENKKRVKTFKIDDSSIPFTYSFEDKNILLVCLDAFFENKNLIQEYFEKVE